jgi:glycosyltransferase involved in cell wall biosynthesis
MSPKATVAVCTKGRPDLLAQSLPLLRRAAEAAGDTEVLVVEQGGQYAAALADQHGARYVPDTGTGVSRARNVAAARAAGSVVLFTDDDCLVAESWVRDHLSALEDATLSASFGVVEGLARTTGGDTTSPRRRHELGAVPWDVGHSSNVAVRREALVDVGGFDERIGPGSGGVPAGEDADLIVRLLAGGHVVVSGTGVPVRHAEWRTADEDTDVLAGYERGAGVWIGASLRARRPYAARHLAKRLRLLGWRMGVHLRDRDVRGAARFVRELSVGLARGVRLEPWPGSQFLG